ncbi:MAG: helix-turn-helix domain-containing protein [Planctomycetes bacterium]|nr:helix-turn-helix domain-containing protein [Planctomycetota bacterium]
MSLLTVKQAAAHLGVSPATVYALCAFRRLRHERHGLGRGRILIPLEALEEYRQSVTVEVGEPPSPAPRSSPSPSRFTMLDGERLKAAWRRQGALGDRRGGKDSARSSESSGDPSIPPGS